MNYRNIIFLLTCCLLLVSVQGVQAASPKKTKEKTIKLSYQVNLNSRLELDNKYGNIQIENHQGNTIEVGIVIRAWDITEAKAQATLDRISIQREKDHRQVELKTVIERQKDKSMNSYNNRGFSIDYIIKMPEQMDLELENTFGNVQLANVLGEVEVEVKHGNFSGETLGGGEIEVKFGNVAIQTLRRATEIEVKHGNLQVGTAPQLEIDQSYGSLQLGSIMHLEGDLSHGSMSVEQIAVSLEWENKYGSVSIGKMAPNFQKAEIEVKHGNVMMNVASTSKFDFEMYTEHGTISHNTNHVEVLEEQEEYTNKLLKGMMNGGGNGMVEIAVSFGNISMY